MGFDRFGIGGFLGALATIVVDVDGYREVLGAMARSVLVDRSQSPWYLQQQARLLLSSIGDMSVAANVGTDSAELQPYAALQRAAMYEQAHGAELRDALPLALGAQQLHPTPRRFGPWLVSSRIEVSSLAVFLTVALFAWLSGPFAAIVAVPVLIVVTSIARHVPALDPVAILLMAEGSTARDAPTQTVSQNRQFPTFLAAMWNRITHRAL